MVSLCANRHYFRCFRLFLAILGIHVWASFRLMLDSEKFFPNHTMVHLFVPLVNRIPDENECFIPALY